MSTDSSILLAVEDHLDALAWAESLGGLDALIDRSQANLNAIRQWVKETDWVEFLAESEATQSSTSICLKIIAPAFTQLGESEQSAFVKKMTTLLESHDAAYDIASYRDAPPGLRLWGGATVEANDLHCLTGWLNWAFGETKASIES